MEFDRNKKSFTLVLEYLDDYLPILIFEKKDPTTELGYVLDMRKLVFVGVEKVTLTKHINYQKQTEDVDPFLFISHLEKEFPVCTGISIAQGSTADKLLVQVEVPGTKWRDCTFECLDVKAGRKIYKNMASNEEVLENEDWEDEY